MLFKRITARLRRALFYAFNRRCFGHLSKSSDVRQLLRIDGKKNIFIHDRVVIQRQTWLAAEPLTGNACRLTIGNGAVIGHFNHIYATRSVTIEQDVLTADKVYISDCTHSYRDVGTPIVRQPVRQLAGVVIGRGAWLGENVCVIGASVGRGCVIGANSVVTTDIPDYSVAVGAPAKVVKRYNQETQTWEKI